MAGERREGGGCHLGYRKEMDHRPIDALCASIVRDEPKNTSAEILSVTSTQ